MHLFLALKKGSIFSRFAFLKLQRKKEGQHFRCVFSKFQKKKMDSIFPRFAFSNFQCKKKLLPLFKSLASKKTGSILQDNYFDP